MANSELINVATTEGEETRLGVVWYGNENIALAQTDDPKFLRTPKGNQILTSTIRRECIPTGGIGSPTIPIKAALLRINT